MPAKPPAFTEDFTEATVSTRLAFDGGLLKVRGGMTTLEELISVTNE
jgi:hypothetical protein